MDNTNTNYNIYDFVYLNPDIHVGCNLSTIDAIYNYVNSNPEIISLSNIPKSFVPNIYLNNLSPTVLSTASKTNSDIYKSILLDGVSSNIVDSMGGYVSLIHQDIQLISENLFSTDSNFLTSYFSSNEKILIIKDQVYQIFATVSEIIDDYSFTVDTTFAINDLKSSYKISGFYVYDEARLASIKYLTYSNEEDLSYYSIDSDFNPILYQTLYPESFRYTAERGYVDYIQNYPSRIGKTSELSRTTASSNSYQYNELHLYNKLILDFDNSGGYIVWNNLKILDISQDVFTDSYNLSTFGNNLITERAIKTYVDNKFLDISSNINFVHDLNPSYFDLGNIDYFIDLPGKARFNRAVSIGEDVIIDPNGLINTKILVKSSEYTAKYTLDNIMTTFTYKDDSYIHFEIENKYASFFIVGDRILIKNNILQIISIRMVEYILKVECILIIVDENIELEVYPYTTAEKITILIDENSKNSENSNIIVIENSQITENSLGFHFEGVVYSNVVLTNNLNVDISDHCFLFEKNIDFAYSPISGENSSILSLDSNSYYIMRNVESKLKDVFHIIDHAATSERDVTIRIYNTTVPLQTYYMIRNFKYFTLNMKTWKIKKIYNVDYISGSVNLDISVFGDEKVAYNSLILGYVLIDLRDVSDQNEDMVFFNTCKDYYNNDNNNDNNNGNSVFFSQGGHISLFDSTVNVNDNMIITESNTFNKGSISLINNNLQIKQFNDGIIIDNKSGSGIIYIGSSNISVDNKGNLRSYGQIISPYFSESVPSVDNENVISELLDRVGQLEDIVKKYNLF